MATKSKQNDAAKGELPSADVWPAPAPAPIASPEFDAEDTWMTFGLGVEGEEEDRTVTVVFSRNLEDPTEEFTGGPLSPVFPGSR